MYITVVVYHLNSVLTVARGIEYFGVLSIGGDAMFGDLQHASILELYRCFSFYLRCCLCR